MRWRKSTRSDSHGEACVEIAGLPGMIAIRDSKNPDGPKLVFGRSVLVALSQKVQSGHRDL